MAVALRESGLPQDLDFDFLADSCLHAYGQILFSRSRVTAGLLVAATALDPALLLAGLGATFVAALSALVLRYDPESIREGYFGYNALLVALATAALLGTGPRALLILFIAVVGSVLVTAATRAALGITLALPALSLPFLFVVILLLGASPMLGLETQPLKSEALYPVALPETVELYLRSLGAIFFLPRVDAGLLVAVALLVHSRIAVVLSLIGFSVSYLLGIHLAGLSGTTLPLVLGFNFILVAVALGGVWFVPGPASFLFATVGSLLCGLIVLGLLPILNSLHVPLLIVPFNLTVLLLIYAMRQRIKDESPKMVDFLLGSPEDNLNFFRTRLARFGSRYLTRFSAPFRGQWTCTQSVDGPHTHKGQWNQALDFEVFGPNGQKAKGSGRTPGDYYCYRLPVLAPADGTVVKVVDGIRDNPIGEVNLDDNWGNLVIIYHSPLVYTLLAHLAPNTIKVQQGQIVRRGDEVGRCGNSGRSPEPHLHFQIQATGRVGAATTAMELHDVVADLGDGPQLISTHVPDQGASLRNIDAQEDVAHLFFFSYDKPQVLEVSRDDRVEREEVIAEIDLYGNLLLRSSHNAVLYYERTDALFTVYDVLGPSNSALHLLQAALARVPFEGNSELRWTDQLRSSRFSSQPVRWLQDFVAPFLPRRGLEVRYQLSWTDGNLEVRGESTLQHQGEPALRTRAELIPHSGLNQIDVSFFGKQATVKRVLQDEAKTA